jgi:hypothetical protein
LKTPIPSSSALIPRGRTYPLFEDIISYPGSKKGYYILSISRPKKRIWIYILYPLSKILPALSQFLNNKKPDLVALQHTSPRLFWVQVRYKSRDLVVIKFPVGSPNLLCVYLQTSIFLAYLSKNTDFWSFGVLLKSSQFHIFLNAQIGSNLKLWMLQHFWVNSSLKILLFWHQLPQQSERFFLF